MTAFATVEPDPERWRLLRKTAEWRGVAPDPATGSLDCMKIRR
jgi:hypothetical protein